MNKMKKLGVLVLCGLLVWCMLSIQNYMYALEPDDIQEEGSIQSPPIEDSTKEIQEQIPVDEPIKETPKLPPVEEKK